MQIILTKEELDNLISKDLLESEKLEHSYTKIKLQELCTKLADEKDGCLIHTGMLQCCDTCLAYNYCPYDRKE